MVLAATWCAGEQKVHETVRRTHVDVEQIGALLVVAVAI